MTDDSKESAISLAQLERLLSEVDQNTVLVGGQALAFWVDRYGVSLPPDVFTEGISGTSIGKLCCGLNIVNLDGSPCSMTAAFKRDLAYYMDGLFFGLIAYESMKKGPLQQRYGDVWAKTVVVRKKEFLPSPMHPTWRLLVGIFIGSLALMTVQLAMMLTKIFRMHE